MLTLLETTNAIKKLDTEPDVIRAACMEVLYFGLKSRLGPDATHEAIAQDIALEYGAHVPDKGKLLIAFCMAAGFTAAFLCKPGHEIPLVSSMMDQIRETFTTMRAKKLAMLRVTDPEEATRQLLAMLAQRGNDKEE